MSALKALEELQDIEKHRYVRTWVMALTYTALGDRDTAIAYLQTGYEIKDVLIMLKVERILEPPRSDPRYLEIVRKMNFPEK